jgi:gamma-glutamyltranspeptidase/glutathione hydrolase
MKPFENFRKTFMPGGRTPREGDLFRNPDLARTYEIIAAGGRDAFYRGELADTIDAYCRRAGCFLRRSDLEAHRSTWVEPLATTYRGYEVYELPPNGQGLAVLEMLDMLEPIDLRSLGHNSAAYLHTLIEAKKLAFEDRARFYADPAFGRLPIEGLLSSEYAAQRWKLFDPGKALRDIPPGDPRLDEGDTVYLCAADTHGNMVSLIQSNYRGMGSGLVPDGLGFMLQDRGQLFSLEDGHRNVYEPGKRPFHTIIPGFVMRDGKPFLAFGVMGGAMQPQGHVQVLCNIIDFGMGV